jgi:hypothetical protein
MNTDKIVKFNKYKFIKWSNNTKYEKSYIKDRDNINNEKNNVVEQALTENLALNNKTEFDRLIPEGFTKQSNKREGQNEKLLSRGMMIQKNINPFLDTSHYLKHLDEEQNYLRPKDSNF